LFIVTFIQIMLPREQRIPTAIPRELDHRDLVVQGGNHIRGQLLLVRNEKTHLHEKISPNSIKRIVPDVASEPLWLKQPAGNPARTVEPL
jgi:hypothetical protein